MQSHWLRRNGPERFISAVVDISIKFVVDFHDFMFIMFIPANSCSYSLSREPYLRFTRGLFYRDRREKLSLAHQCANFGAQNCSPENCISGFLLCPQCKAVLTKAHTTKTRRGHLTEF